MINQGVPSAMFIPQGDGAGGGIGPDEAARVAAAFRMAFARAGRGGIAVGEHPGQLQILQWPTKDIIDMTST